MDIDMRTKPTLVGERVILRPVSADDAPGLLDLVSDDEGNRLTATHDLQLTLESAQGWYGSRGEETTGSTSPWLTRRRGNMRGRSC